MELPQGVVCLGEFLELLEGALQVFLGGQRLAQHLHGAAQVEVEVGVGAFLGPRVDEALFRFFQAFSNGELLVLGSGGVEQGFAQVVVAAELERFESDCSTLSGQVFFQIEVAFGLV